MSRVLPSSVVDDSFRMITKTVVDGVYFDWRFHALAYLKNENNGVQSEVDNIEEEENPVTIAYAGIGHEILVGTLAAFKVSLFCDVTSSKEDNIGMLCSLVAQIYRNKNYLCDPFWQDWDDYCSSRKAVVCKEAEFSERNAIQISAYPVCHLLDAALTLAKNALDNKIISKVRHELPGEKSAAMLPSLVPLLRTISSFIPSHGRNVCSVIADFFS